MSLKFKLFECLKYIFIMNNIIFIKYNLIKCAWRPALNYNLIIMQFQLFLNDWICFYDLEELWGI